MFCHRLYPKLVRTHDHSFYFITVYTHIHTYMYMYILTCQLYNILYIEYSRPCVCLPTHTVQHKVVVGLYILFMCVNTPRAMETDTTKRSKETPTEAVFQFLLDSFCSIRSSPALSDSSIITLLLQDSSQSMNSAPEKKKKKCQKGFSMDVGIQH